MWKSVRRFKAQEKHSMNCWEEKKEEEGGEQKEADEKKPECC